MAQPSSHHEHSVGHPFTVGIIHLDLMLHGCQSLKDKRGRLARITTHLRKTHPIVISEVGDQNLWQRAALAAVTLSPDRNLANRILEAVADTLSKEPDTELLYYETELI